MMLPILISVSLAPVSYFFCAKDGLLVAASNARAAEKAPIRSWIAGILISPWITDDCACCAVRRFAAVACIEYLLLPRSNKKLPATGSQGARFLVVVRAD